MRPSRCREVSTSSRRRARSATRRRADVLLVDSGAKDSIVRKLLRARRVACCAPFTRRSRSSPRDVDGIMLTNGPGDPADLGRWSSGPRLLVQLRRPVFGICLGHQMLALAAGGDDVQAAVRPSRQNQPVQDLLTRALLRHEPEPRLRRGRRLPPGDWEPWFVNLNDGTNEGIRIAHAAALRRAVPPEAAPGPARHRVPVRRLPAAGRRRCASVADASCSDAQLPTKPRRALVLGSGALQIGQAGEFDYSGSQALKALKEEGVYTVLINPNIATIQTSRATRGRVYFLAGDRRVRRAGHRQGDGSTRSCSRSADRPRSTAASSCETPGVLARARRARCSARRSRRSATPRTASSSSTPARDRRQDRAQPGLRLRSPRPRRRHARSASRSCCAAAFSLGGKGAASSDDERGSTRRSRARSPAACRRSWSRSACAGWKEIEYEVVRDGDDNCITVCNMENFDPMGIHTGESIVVAPSQTLDDHEYQFLRDIAIRRRSATSASSASATSSTRSTRDRRLPGHRGQRAAVALVGARLARRPAIRWRTSPRRSPSATPARDPERHHAAHDGVLRARAGLHRLQDSALGPRRSSRAHRPSIGTRDEVASARSWPSAARFPRCCRRPCGCSTSASTGSTRTPSRSTTSASELADPRRRGAMFARGARRSTHGMSVDEIHELTEDRSVGSWREIAAIVAIARAAVGARQAPLERGRAARGEARSASPIAPIGSALPRRPRGRPRGAASAQACVRSLAQIDTLAAEYPAETNYLYSTYARAGRRRRADARRKKVLVLGSGATASARASSSTGAASTPSQAAREARLRDASCSTTTRRPCQHRLRHLRPAGLRRDQRRDACSRSYEREQPDGVDRQHGRPDAEQPGAAAAPARACPSSARRREHRPRGGRGKFCALLDELGDRPAALGARHGRRRRRRRSSSASAAIPVLVRPSYVLSRRGDERRARAERARSASWTRGRGVSPEHPVVDLEVRDARARDRDRRRRRRRRAGALGDQRAHRGRRRAQRRRDARAAAADALHRDDPAGPADRRASWRGRSTITGPFNMQFLAKHNDGQGHRVQPARVAELSVRLEGHWATNFVAEAMRRMLGVARAGREPQSSTSTTSASRRRCSRSRALVGADPMLGVEMAITGEVGCFGDDVHEALLHALLATGFRFPTKGVLLSLGPLAGQVLVRRRGARHRRRARLPIYATPGTAEALARSAIACTSARQGSEAGATSAVRGDRRGAASTS